ncbi:branched-chain amino acid ABC transporter permease [Achromobacter spanius]|uniref:branched-chain amino acid ABC transporter permease n=1 Tax=Achromobacter spanius TaxID=217203 RepID=UPI003209A5E9
MSKAVLPTIPPAPDRALIRGAAAPQPLGLPSVLGLGLLACVPFFLNQAFTYHLAIFICINTVVVTSLSVLARAGQVSLCHGALAGVGAYASVFCVKGLGLPFIVGVAAAMVAAGCVAYLLGRIVLRLQGVYFVLVTFAFGELLRLVLLEFGDVTGGANGITNIPAPAIAGYVFVDKAAFYALAALVAVGVLAFFRWFYASPAGEAVDAVGENPALAESSGIGVRRTQLFAFTLASVFAGLGGALLAHYVGYISPESFNMHLSVALIIMMVVGGRRHLLGGLIGALVMTPLPELFRGAVESQDILYGVALILMLRFLPQGLAGMRLPGKQRKSA